MQAEARTTGALEHHQLVPQGQYFGLQGRSRSNRVAQTHEQGKEERPHGEAYPPTAVTSTPRTRTEYLVGTGKRRHRVHPQRLCGDGRERTVLGLLARDEYQWATTAFLARGARFNPTAFQAVSFQPPRRVDGG